MGFRVQRLKRPSNSEIYIKIEIENIERTATEMPGELWEDDIFVNACTYVFDYQQNENGSNFPLENTSNPCLITAFRGFRCSRVPVILDQPDHSAGNGYANKRKSSLPISEDDMSRLKRLHTSHRVLQLEELLKAYDMNTCVHHRDQTLTGARACKIQGVNGHMISFFS